MQDKRQVKREIITYLCGDHELSFKFIRLLKAGDLTEKDGKIIRNKLIGQIDSNYNFHLLFEDCYRNQLKSRDDYPTDEMRKYLSDEEYLRLLDKHFPQSVSEAVDIIISMLDNEDISEIIKQDKTMFGAFQHFGLGLFMRNHFGINLNQSKTLYADILEKSGQRFYMSDDVSGYLLDEVWYEIQKKACENPDLKSLLKECDNEYFKEDYGKLLEISDRILEKYPYNQNAMGYNGIAYCFLNHPENAVEVLQKATMIYPNNYYLKNNLSMAYYDLGEYEKSIKCCEEGLKIKSFDWLWENKMKALLKLGLVDEAVECYEYAPFSIEIVDLMIDNAKYAECLKYCIEEDIDEFESIVDRIKEKDTSQIGDYYISWIYNIKSKSDTRTCPECGGELIPILWGYPDHETLERGLREEIFLGGCCLPLNPPNYHCKNCDEDFDLGYRGFHIECEDYKLTEYIEYKIRELTSKLKTGSMVAVKSLESLKKELEGYDDEEFMEFINHLKDLDYLYEPREGFIKLVGFDDFKCMKEYCDEGKYAAPRWLVYPQLSAGTIGWRMGAGENYAMNMPYYGEEFDKLFPKPRYWELELCEKPIKPVPPIGYYWSVNGKPIYSNNIKGIIVNDFITLSDEGEFSSDAFTFKSIEDAVNTSKSLYIEKYGFEVVEMWEAFSYSVLLNASYFKIMQDKKLKEKLLATGDEPLVYDSDDGENLFGRALMEVRDEIRRLYKNEDKIDWEYTEYLKYKPWLD